MFRKSTCPLLAIIRGFSKTHQSSLTLNEGFFLKSPRPSLPLKRAPPLSPSPFPLRGQGMCQPPYSVLKPLRYKVGGPSEVFASSRAAVCGMRPHGQESLTGCLLNACCLLNAHSMLAAHAECSPDACWGLVIAAKGYLESFSVNMFLRKRVLPRM